MSVSLTNNRSVARQVTLTAIALVAVVLVLVGRERLIRPWQWFGRAQAQKGGAA